MLGFLIFVKLLILIMNFLVGEYCAHGTDAGAPFVLNIY